MNNESFVPSDEQKAIGNAIENTDGNIMIEARAGCGKSTTLRWLSGLAQKRGGRVIIVQFNSSGAKENASKVPLGVSSLTLHAHGNSSLRKPHSIDSSGEKMKNIAYSFFSDDDENVFDWVTQIKEGVAKAKNWACQPGDLHDIREVLVRHDIAAPNEENRPEALDELVSYVSRALADSIAVYKNSGVVDYDDMLWLPVVLNLRVNKYDYMFVDESQDLNKVQFLLIEKSLTPNGRVIFCGDPAQAIYGFRGAMPDSMDICAKRFNTTKLKLSTTYRCGKSIVALANKHVPDLTAFHTSHEGMVSEVSRDQMIKLVKVGDFILSRKNAPMVSICMKLIKENIPAVITGRDIGKSLITIVKKSKKKTVDTFLSYLVKWEEKEIERVEKRKSDDLAALIEGIKDKVEVLRIVCEGKSKIDSVILNLENLFSDKDSPEKVVTLSSTHKAKGLERERVFMLSETYNLNSHSKEEKNLWYVAVTRAKKELYMVRKPADSYGE